MAQSSAEARQEIENAREGVEKELDDLTRATRDALDIPAKVKRNPVRTAGLATGAAFLLLGGPRRVARRAEAKFLPKRVHERDRALPKNVQATMDKLEPAQRELVEAHLERDFAAYMNKEHPVEPANARQSFWKSYDVLVGIVGAAAARELVKKLFEVPKEVEVEQIEGTGDAIADAEKQVAAAKSAAKKA